MNETTEIARSGTAPSPAPAGGKRPVITRAHKRELEAERDRRRRQLEVDFAERFRAAREFGPPGDNDEYLQIREEEGVLAARIASLSLLLGSATVLDESEPRMGVAAIGSTVEVDFMDSGERRKVHLVGGRETLAPDVASVGSPIGRALIGRQAGADVRVELPGGQERRLRIIAVASGRSRGPCPDR